jgi:hypothetical protein
MIFNNLYRNKNTVRYPDFTNVIKSFTGGSVTHTYTPTKDGWILFKSLGNTSRLEIAGIKVAHSNHAFMPVQRGTEIKLYDNDNGTCFYGCQK